MGAAASALPDKLSEEQLKAICGDKFDQSVYDSLKDQEGFVQRDQFLAVSGLGKGSSTADHEAEARHVFNAYSHNSDMDSRTFIKLCKDLKFLNKKFSSGDADLIYQKAKAKHGAVTYEVFRQEILVDMAVRKEIDVSKLLGKVAASDGPVLHATAADNVRFHDDTSTYTGAIAKNENFKNDLTQAGDEHHNAALKLQKVQRGKNAQRQVEELKQVNCLSLNYSFINNLIQ